MKKVYHSSKFRHYCNKIRAKYQEKRHRQIIKKSKLNKNNEDRNKASDKEYDSLELTFLNVNKLIKDVEFLKKKNNFRINFKKLDRFDLGMCLIFTSLLKELRKIKKTSFGFRKELMPKDKKIKSLFIQTGIFEILCDKPIHDKSNLGKIRVLEVYINSQQEFKKVLLRISNELIEYSLQQIGHITDKETAKMILNKIFLELLLNVQSHSKSLEKMVYLAGEVENSILKFAILDSGIGFVGSIKARSTILDKGKEILTNYVQMIFETNKDRDREYSGQGFRRGNGTRRLKETVQKCGGKLQIVSKRDFYELKYNNNTLKCETLVRKVNENLAIGTLISFELPVVEFLKGVQNASV
ncbi:hypothetical protein [Helicobacter sp. 23-1046]